MRNESNIDFFRNAYMQKYPSFPFPTKTASLTKDELAMGMFREN